MSLIRRRLALTATLALTAATAPACAPCDCAANPDPDTGVQPDPDDDPDDDPTRDRFRPGRVAIEGAFAYDPNVGQATGWADRDGTHALALFVRMTDDRYLGAADPRHRCRVRLAPIRPVEASVERFTFSFGGGDPEREYAHLMFALAAGGFSVVDAPYETRDGGVVRGCIDIQDDPERGFSLRFGNGSVVRWATTMRWGLGVGELAAVVQADLEALPDTSYTRELWDAGVLGGASARVNDENTDFIAPLGAAVGTAIDERGHIVYDRGLPVMLPATAFTEIAQRGELPPAARFQVTAFYAITFE
jgi:hypothetical protein